jgi:2-dehydro-3-deoxygalactonokinase
MAQDAVALIGLDWGTSSLRAYRLGAGGGIVEVRESPAGILGVEAGGFEAAFEAAIGDWLGDSPAAPVVASGMITSRQGWVEVPYLGCPAGEAALARALRAHRTGAGRHVHFVPGLALDGDGVPDVMRGEETQVIGALDGARDARLFLLPGTHSKWVLAENGRIAWFATFMTGELFAVLKDHSILGRPMAGAAHDADAFARGLGLGGLDDPGAGGLLKRLFSARTRHLAGELPADAVASYLSGLLIGAELREATACVGERAARAPLTVIGADALAERYLAAAALNDLEAARGPAHAVARGHWRLARAAGLIAKAAA